jgi:hypothetical protein
LDQRDRDVLIARPCTRIGILALLVLLAGAAQAGPKDVALRPAVVQTGVAGHVPARASADPRVREAS